MGIEEKVEDLKFEPLFNLIGVAKLPEPVQQRVKDWIQEGVRYAAGACDAVYAPLDPAVDLSRDHPSWTYVAQGDIPKKGRVRLGYDQKGFDRCWGQLMGLRDQVRRDAGESRDVALAKVGFGIDWGLMTVRRDYSIEAHRLMILRKGSPRYCQDYDRVQKVRDLFSEK